MGAEPTSFVTECFWPDVNDVDLATLDRRIGLVVSALAGDHSVRYLGSILLCEDEVLLCQFAGSAGDVRAVAERAKIPFERILATVNSPAAAPAPARFCRELPLSSAGDPA